MKLEYSRQTFEKYSNIKFHENPPTGNRVSPWGRTDIRTDMTELAERVSRTCLKMFLSVAQSTVIHLLPAIPANENELLRCLHFNPHVLHALCYFRDTKYPLAHNQPTVTPRGVSRQTSVVYEYSTHHSRCWHVDEVARCVSGVTTWCCKQQ